MRATHYCIACGREFVAASPDVVLCPDCGGPLEATADRLDPGVTLQEAEPGVTPFDAAGDSSSYTGEDDIPAVWQAGDVILDLYEVLGKLGEGGFGTVYRVHHRTWNLDLAVKSPNAEVLRRAGTVEDFVSEAESWMDLGLHPHIVTCHYVRTLGAIPRVFAELVEGGSLSHWIRDGRLYAGGRDAALARMLDIAIQFAWGLHYAHEQGMIHQDVKPANVLLTREGVAKVTDFGLVRARSVETVSGLQGGSRVVRGRGMTPAYCSPEQAAGDALSRRTDLWSWGLSVLEMFAGRAFWVTVPGATVGQLAPQALEHYASEGPAVEGIPPMPGGLLDLLRETFREDPDARPHDLQGVAEQLCETYRRVTGRPYAREQPKPAELRADSLNNHALSLLDIGKEDEAEAAWEEALQGDAYHPATNYNLGLRRWRAGSLGDLELVRQLEAVRWAYPAAWLPLYLLALVHLERDDCAAAVAVLEGVTEEYTTSLVVGAALDQARQRSPFSRRLLLTFGGHEHPVNAVGLGANGRQVLSCSVYTLRLWDVTTGQCLLIFDEHEGGADAVCLSVDGRHACSGDYQGTLKLWDVATGRCRQTFKGHEERVKSVCLSVDGRLALSASWDRRLKLWDVATGWCLRTFQGHKSRVNSVCLSIDGRQALSGSEDRTLKLWDVATGQCLRTFQGHRLSVNSDSMSADGCLALSGSNDNTLKLWDFTSGRCLRTLKGHNDWVKSVRLTADGRFALSGSQDRTLKLWDVATGRCLRTFEGHRSWVDSVCLSADGRYAVSGSEDSSLKLWEVLPDGYRYSAPAHLSGIVSGEAALQRVIEFRSLLARAAESREHGRFALAARLVREARALPGYAHNEDALSEWTTLYSSLPRSSLQAAWEVRTFERDRTEWQVNSVCLSSDGRLALSGDFYGNLGLWDVAAGKCLRTLEGYSMVLSVCLSSDGRLALSGDVSGKLKLWDVATGKRLRTFEGHRESVNSVTLSSDARLALSGSQDGTLRLWNIATGRCWRTYDGHSESVNSVCFGVDQRYALSGSEDRTLKLWDVATGQCLRTYNGHRLWVLSVYLSADGRYALSGSKDGTLRLWNVATGQCLRTFEGHRINVSSVCLSADGHYALSGSGDRTLKLWDIATGRCLRTFEGHKGPVHSVCLSADGRYAVSGSEDRSLKLWLLDWELEERPRADWDEGACPYLDTFLTLHTPYADGLPTHRESTEEEIRFALTRRGTPTWTEPEFQYLLTELGYRGYGWLKPEGVRRKLEQLARGRH